MDRDRRAPRNRLRVRVRHRRADGERLRAFLRLQRCGNLEARHALRVSARFAVAAPRIPLVVAGPPPPVGALRERIVLVALDRDLGRDRLRRPLGRRVCDRAAEEEGRSRLRRNHVPGDVVPSGRLNLHLELGDPELGHREARGRDVAVVLAPEPDPVGAGRGVRGEDEFAAECAQFIQLDLARQHVVVGRVANPQGEGHGCTRDRVGGVIVKAHDALVEDGLARTVDGPFGVEVPHRTGVEGGSGDFELPRPGAEVPRGRGHAHAPLPVDPHQLIAVPGPVPVAALSGGGQPRQPVRIRCRVLVRAGGVVVDRPRTHARRVQRFTRVVVERPHQQFVECQLRHDGRIDHAEDPLQRAAGVLSRRGEEIVPLRQRFRTAQGRRVQPRGVLQLLVDRLRPLPKRVTGGPEGDAVAVDEAPPQQRFRLRVRQTEELEAHLLDSRGVVVEHLLVAGRVRREGRGGEAQRRIRLARGERELVGRERPPTPVAGALRDSHGVFGRILVGERDRDFLWVPGVRVHLDVLGVHPAD